MKLAGEYRTSSSPAAAEGAPRRDRLPLLRDKIAGGKNPRIVAVEPSSCPTLTKGIYAYDFGDTAKLTPLIKMYTSGTISCPRGSTREVSDTTGTRRW